MSSNSIKVSEHPLPKIPSITDDPKSLKGVKGINTTEVIVVFGVAIFSCYKFMTYFFYSFKNRKQTTKAMYFWIFGAFLNSFLAVFELFNSRIDFTPSLESTFQVLLSILDMWPMIVVVLLSLDVLNETDALSEYETRVIKNLSAMFTIYSIFLPMFHSAISSTLTDLSSTAFINITYIPLTIFVVFVSYVFLRIFICERNITSLFFGSKALRKFQIGLLFLIVSLYVKIVLLYMRYIPPYTPSDIWFFKNGEIEYLNKIGYQTFMNLIIYILPYGLIAAGANYTKSKENVIDDNETEHSGKIIHESISLS